MKRKRIIRLTEQDLETILNTVLGAVGMSSKDIFGGATDEKIKKGDLEGIKHKKETFGSSLVNSKFEELTGKVINNLEGGYYHPIFKEKGAKSLSGAYLSPSNFTKMGESGETMFGIDRVNGGSINTTPAGLEFWSIIDKANAKEKWPYGFMGGKYQSQLIPLVSEIMKPQYESNAKNYLTDKSRKIVESNEGLLFNFIYGSWNGPGWFQRFAKVFNDLVSEGITDPIELNDAVNLRRLNSGNSLIAQGAPKVEKVTDSLV